MLPPSTGFAVFGVTISVGLLGHGATLMVPVVVNDVTLTPHVVAPATTVQAIEAPVASPGRQLFAPAAPLNLGEAVGLTACCLASRPLVLSLAEVLCTCAAAARAEPPKI